jgi:hypothetical protein
MKLNFTSLLLACVAAAGAAWLVDGTSTPAYEDQLIGVAVHQSFGDSATEITAEPLEIQALLLDYADNELLLLKARLALLRYPDLARRILPVYGADPDFQMVLQNYGEAVLPLIAYFMDHDLASLEMRRALADRAEETRQLYAQLMGTSQEVAPPGKAPVSELTAERRGWYAVNFLLEDGYDFLGQFAVAPDGKAGWVQTERVTDGLMDLLFGGVQDLETKWRLGEEIKGPDLGWAALDVAVIASFLKLLKAARTGRAVAPGSYAGSTAVRSGGFAQRVSKLGSRVLARGGRLGLTIASYGAIPAAVYLMFRYPSMINATLAELGGWLGVEPWLLQFLFWFVVISVIMRLALFLLGPLSWTLRSLGWMTGILAARYRSTRVHRRLDPRVI